MKYSFSNLVRQTLKGHAGWTPAWRDPSPKARYDAIVVGGGGHGLATAYYLAREHDITKVAVLEKGLIGQGNAGRNTTIVRANYLLEGNEPFYEWSLKLWEGLEQELNYNVMMSQRGVINLYHSDSQRDAYVRRGDSMLMHGSDAVLQRPLPGARRADAAARRHRTPRRGRLGLCPRRRSPRRRYHPELRGHRDTHRERRGDRR